MGNSILFFFCICVSLELIGYEIKFWQKNYIPKTFWYKDFLIIVVSLLWALFYYKTNLI